MSEAGMTQTLKLGQLLVAQGLIHPDELAAALAAQQGLGGGRVGGALIAMGAIQEEALGERTVSAEIIGLVPAELAEKHRCMPLFLRDEGSAEVLVLGMEDPSDADAISDVQGHVRCGLQPVLIAPTELDLALERYYRSSGPGEAADERMDLSSVLVPVAASGEAGTAQAPTLPPMELKHDPSWSERADDPGIGDVIFADEDPFAGFEKEPFAAEAGSALREEPTDPLSAAADTSASSASARQDAILQALAQLLVEKGIITREEFAARLRQLTRQSD
jgi:hypothetical protein